MSSFWILVIVLQVVGYIAIEWITYYLRYVLNRNRNKKYESALMYSWRSKEYSFVIIYICTPLLFAVCLWLLHKLIRSK